MPKQWIGFWVVLLLLQLSSIHAAESHAEAIEQAMASDRIAAAKIQADQTRPVFHFRAMANWMNDPNGPIYHQGRYHMFYQHNPTHDDWGNLHWGHAVSKDLLHWVHYPHALAPSKELGENHVYSGCAAINGNGQPMLFYTSIGHGKSDMEYAEQWAAVGDPQLMTWSKLTNNPVLSLDLHGDLKVSDWRDPFIFDFKGEKHMVLGGNLNKRKGGEAVVLHYKAKNKELTAWEYKGIIFRHPDPKVVNIECPNFFELDGKWVLIISPHREVEYFVGSFDGETFRSEKSGLLDVSGNFYAPNSLVDGRNRRVLWGWVRGWPKGRGWNGCLSVPRVLEVKRDGTLIQKPARELEKLRGKRNGAMKGNSFEVMSELDRRKKEGFTVRSDKMRVAIQATEGGVQVGDRSIPLGADEKRAKVRLFWDRSVLEVFVNERNAVTMVFPDLADPELEVVLEEQGVKPRKLDFWSMKSVW
ncbi:MAG: glycoside hydrolase family 32 protein [Verrucomicrobiota bacterium]|nr:glycoside hydrolase family 32 protein [Verrucomicrobiota bacterium]